MRRRYDKRGSVVLGGWPRAVRSPRFDRFTPSHLRHTFVIRSCVRIRRLIWDEHNEAHIAGHKVTPAEVEAWCSASARSGLSTTRTGGEGWWPSGVAPDRQFAI